MRDPGAGFVIIKYFDDSPKVLGLISPQDKRTGKGGIYDIPKGGLEEGESFLNCAFRECEEECGIVISEKDMLPCGAQTSTFKIFVAITDQVPVVSKNPKTGILEHDGAKWLEPQDLVDNSFEWLKPYIQICLKCAEIF